MKKVFESSNRAEAHLILHALEDEGIKAALKAEFSSFEPASIWIDNDADHDKAVELISDIQGTKRGKPGAAGKKDRSAGIMFGIGIALGVCLGVLIMSINSDKKERDARKQTAWDVNGDGRIDRWREYRPDKTTIEAIDENADGKPDYWSYYRDNAIIKDEGDCDNDGIKDYWGKYSNYSVVERNWSFLNDTIIDRRVLYRHNKKSEEYLDTNRDGKFDCRIFVDDFERIVKKELIR